MAPLPDQLELVLNPAVELRLTLTVARKDHPLQSFALDSRERRALALWLLTNLDSDFDDGTDGSDDDQVELGPELVPIATELGILISPRDVPVEEQPYRCAIDGELRDLVPAMHRARAASAAAESDRLRLNPGVHLPESDALPEAIADRVRQGEAVWAHLGPSFPITGPKTLSAERPLLWVEQPTTGMLEPSWGAERWRDLLRAVLGGRPIGSLSLDERETLLLANVLLPRGDASSEASRAARIEELRASMAAQHHAVIRDVASPFTIAALRRYFRGLRAAGLFSQGDDPREAHRQGIYCDVVSLHLQHQLAGFLDHILPEPVTPSYTWMMRYFAPAVLARHTDRPQCRWNVSLCIDMDPDRGVDGAWPFHLDVDGRRSEVRLGIGDAVVYSGTDTPHWREPLAHGNAVTMCFFHYVPVTFAGDLR